MAKKSKPKLSHASRLAKAAAAGMAKATAGRSRTFAGKKDKLASNKGDEEIDDGLAEFQERMADSEVDDTEPEEEVIVLRVSLNIDIANAFIVGHVPPMKSEEMKKAMLPAVREYLKETVLNGSDNELLDMVTNWQKIE